MTTRDARWDATHATRYDSAWTLEEACALVRMLLPDVLKAGFYLGLTGSTLTRGESKHDVDLIVYPMRTHPEPSKAALEEVFASFGMRRIVEKETIHAAWRRAGSLDEKHIEVWVWKDVTGKGPFMFTRERRVDIFFLR